ncbi:hypothetical protein BGZ96_000188 [Linnemannia gamsii]|uniref:Uncharacterized protein n=1 Tax=Linnemannia gamsii TaxID=64522 RepID=A0ABQ7JPG8_9FUNG|nr:hypothetical protein BGZ96_000188 [Linnemannia gamsii]
MEHEQELPAHPLQDSNISGDYYNNVNDDYEDYLGDMDMSSSILSFGEPDLNGIAQHIISSVFNNAWDTNIQDNGYEDVFMPDNVESFEEPDVDDVAWQVALIAINDALDGVIHDEDGQEAS